MTPASPTRASLPWGRARRNRWGFAFPAVWTGCALLLAQEPPQGIRVLLVLLAGGMLTGLDLVVHEAAHGVLSRSRRRNRWVGFLAGVPGLVSVTAYRHYHLRHHAQSLRAAAREWWLNGTPLYLLAVPCLGWREADAERRRDILVEHAILAAAVSAAVAAAVTGGAWRLLRDAWLLPFAVSVALNAYRGWTETFAAVAVRYEVRHGRPVLPPAWFRLLSDHLVHHLHPALPWHALPDRAAILRAEHGLDPAGGTWLRFLWDRVERRASPDPVRAPVASAVHTP